MHEEPICVQWRNASILVLYQYDINHLLIINLYTNFYREKDFNLYNQIKSVGLNILKFVLRHFPVNENHLVQNDFD